MYLHTQKFKQPNRKWILGSCRKMCRTGSYYIKWNRPYWKTKIHVSFHLQNLSGLLFHTHTPFIISHLMFLSCLFSLSHCTCSIVKESTSYLTWCLSHKSGNRGWWNCIKYSKHSQISLVDSNWGMRVLISSAFITFKQGKLQW